MKRWGVLLMVLGVGSFILPAFGMQFELINLFGDSGDPASAAILFICVGVALYLIASARERRARPTAIPQVASGVPISHPTPAWPPTPRTETPQTFAASPSPATGYNFCGNCGAKVTRATKFCTRCGAAMS